MSSGLALVIPALAGDPRVKSSHRRLPLPVAEHRNLVQPFRSAVCWALANCQANIELAPM